MTGLLELRLQISSEVETIDLSALSGLTELRNLMIYSRNRSGNSDLPAVTDLTPLSGLTKLEMLEIPAEVKSLAPLAGLTELQSLNLYTHHTRNGNSSY